METEFIELDFCVYKPSSMNSVSIHGNRVLYMETEFVELDFLVCSPNQFLGKSSPLDSNC